MAGKLEDLVYEISVTLSFTTNNISKLKTMIPEAKKVAEQAARKSSALKKLPSGDAWAQRGCAPN